MDDLRTQEKVQPCGVREDHQGRDQHLHDELEQEEAAHGPGHLMIGAAVAHRQGRIELQAQRQKLHSQRRAVQGVISRQLVEEIKQCLEKLAYKPHIIGHDKAGQHHHEKRCGKPHSGHDDLGPNLLVDGYRQRHHHIPLVPQQILVEPLDHHHHAHDTHAHDRNNKGHYQQCSQHIQQLILGAQQSAGSEIGPPRRHQQHQVQRQHDPPGCTKLVLHQLDQHLNTSRNSASTLMPFSSRISSTEDCSTRWPWLINNTSSSTFSTSAIRCVEITTAASGL